MIGGSWIFKDEIVNYYKYSLIPDEYEFKLMFGDKYQDFYNEAVLNQKQPSLSGFIRYYKDFINRNTFEYILDRRK